ncbi:MAG: hypothetical protein HY060_26035 [Proteobacteria bacterium]|nr:hypothetical protein [Pseudomonadota bacterium]
MDRHLGKTSSPEPGTPVGVDRPSRPRSPAVTSGPTQARRAALDAQKRYMDDRFGRDRPMARNRQT